MIYLELTPMPSILQFSSKNRVLFVRPKDDAELKMDDIEASWASDPITAIAFCSKLWG